jgi:hypothetical protein
MSIQPIIPTQSDLITSAVMNIVVDMSSTLIGVNSPRILENESYSGIRGREPQLDALSQAPISEEQLLVVRDGLKLDDFSSSQAKYSDLIALISYSLGNDEISVSSSYDHCEGSRKAAISYLGSQTNKAKEQFSDQNFTPEQLSVAISQLLEAGGKNLLPESLSVAQKSFITRVMYEAKDMQNRIEGNKGQAIVDEELLTALAKLREKKTES